MRQQTAFKECSYKNCNENIDEDQYFCSPKCEAYYHREHPTYKRGVINDYKNISRSRLLKRLKMILEDDWRPTSYYVCRYNSMHHPKGYKAVYSALVVLRDLKVLETEKRVGHGGSQRFWRLRT